MQDAEISAWIQRRYQLLAPEMDERRRRQWAAAEARELGWSGGTGEREAGRRASLPLQVDRSNEGTCFGAEQSSSRVRLRAGGTSKRIVQGQ
jgi:hypothetical protein